MLLLYVRGFLKCLQATIFAIKTNLEVPERFEAGVRCAGSKDEVLFFSRNDCVVQQKIAIFRDQLD